MKVSGAEKGKHVLRMVNAWDVLRSLLIIYGKRRRLEDGGMESEAVLFLEEEDDRI